MATYPFVHAAFDTYGVRRAPTLAFVVHMAEGGGTVGYLSRDPRRGVSVHFVIPYTGLTIQMLKLDRISGSINPGTLRIDNDPAFIGYGGESVRFGALAAKTVLGNWYGNPNHAIITVEIEGFARKGPNAAQRVALVHLTRDLITEFPTIRGLLGHRDFQNYKACPGKFIPWSNMAMTVGGGRHGVIHR